MKDDQRIKLTKRLLREALLLLLEKNDINKIAVTQLCQHAGVNRATFYRHYSQPKDILSEIRHEMITDIKNMAIKDKAKDNPMTWLNDVCLYFYNNANNMNILIKCRSDSQFIELINEIYLSDITKLKVNFNNIDSSDFKLITYYYAGGIYYILSQWLTEPINKTPEEIANLIGKLILKNY